MRERSDVQSAILEAHWPELDSQVVERGVVDAVGKNRRLRASHRAGRVPEPSGVLVRDVDVGRPWIVRREQVFVVENGAMPTGGPTGDDDGRHSFDGNLDTPFRNTSQPGFVRDEKLRRAGEEDAPNLRPREA